MIDFGLDFSIHYLSMYGRNLLFVVVCEYVYIVYIGSTIAFNSIVPAQAKQNQRIYNLHGICLRLSIDTMNIPKFTKRFENPFISVSKIDLNGIFRTPRS